MSHDCSTCSTVVHFSRMRCEPNSPLWCTLTALLVTSPSARTTSPGFTHCSMLLLRGPDLQCWSTRASTRKERRGQTWATFICRMYHSCNNVYTLYVWYIYICICTFSVYHHISQYISINIRIVSYSSNVIFQSNLKGIGRVYRVFTCPEGPNSTQPVAPVKLSDIAPWCTRFRSLPTAMFQSELKHAETIGVYHGLSNMVDHHVPHSSSNFLGFPHFQTDPILEKLSVCGCHCYLKWSAFFGQEIRLWTLSKSPSGCWMNCQI